MAASALTRYTAANGTTAIHSDGAIYSYTFAFWCSSAIFTVGAIVCGLILPTHKTQHLASPGYQ